MFSVRPVLVCLAVLFAPSVVTAVVPPYWVPPVPGRLSADGVPLPPGAVRALGSPRFHHGWISTCDYSPGGKQVATGGWGTVNVWDATTGRLLQQVQQPDEQFQAVRFSPDGRFLWAVGQAWKGDKWVYHSYRIDPARGTVEARHPSPYGVGEASTLRRRASYLSSPPKAWRYSTRPPEPQRRSGSRRTR